METPLIVSKAMERYNARFNEIAVSRLFEMYESIGFIYPAKKELLAPHFEQIQQNWNQLIQSSKDLLWVMTNGSEQDGFASVSVIKQANAGVMAQHLVSAGDPFASLKIMLAAQIRAHYHYDESELKSSQNWFRPDNRYAFRIFASMYKKLGAESAALIRFEYLHFPLDRFTMNASSAFVVKEVNTQDDEFISFLKEQYGNVFVSAEELDQGDIELQKLRQSYQDCGLDYRRKVLKVINKDSGRIIAAVIARRAPLGLNFSFLENRSYFIVDKSIAPDQLQPIVQDMLHGVREFYEDFPLQSIPITTDARTSTALQKQGARYQRTYMQSIWLRTGFSQWFDHIHSFLQKIEQRRQRIAH